MWTVIKFVTLPILVFYVSLCSVGIEAGPKRNPFMRPPLIPRPSQTFGEPDSIVAAPSCSYGLSVNVFPSPVTTGLNIGDVIADATSSTAPFSREVVSTNQCLKKRLEIIKIKYLKEVDRLKIDLEQSEQGPFFWKKHFLTARDYLNATEKQVCQYHALVKRFKSGDLSISLKEIFRLRLCASENVIKNRDAVQKTLADIDRKFVKLSPTENEKIRVLCSTLDAEFESLFTRDVEVNSLVMAYRSRLANTIRGVRVEILALRSAQRQEFQDTRQHFEKNAEIKFNHWAMALEVSEGFFRRAHASPLPDKKRSTTVKDEILYSKKVRDEDCLKILGLKAGEQYTLEDISHAYRLLAKIYHPDRPCGDELKFKRVERAYAVLKERRS